MSARMAGLRTAECPSVGAQWELPGRRGAQRPGVTSPYGRRFRFEKPALFLSDPWGMAQSGVVRDYRAVKCWAAPRYMGTEELGHMDGIHRGSEITAPTTAWSYFAS